MMVFSSSVNFECVSGPSTFDPDEHQFKYGLCPVVAIRVGVKFILFGLGNRFLFLRGFSTGILWRAQGPCLVGPTIRGGNSNVLFWEGNALRVDLGRCRLHLVSRLSRYIVRMLRVGHRYDRSQCPLLGRGLRRRSWCI